MSSRAKRARRATRGLHGWKRRIVTTVIAAAATYASLRLWGSRDGSSDQVIVAAMTLATSFLLLPATEFAWHYFWLPWREVKDEIKALKDAEKENPQCPVWAIDVSVSVSIRDQARAGLGDRS
jgi:ABC-type glycerol-3-phosphate transport system substrate-binding protein